MAEPLVDLRSVTRRFGRTVALRDLDFRVEAGTSYGLVGRNGAGKTTLLRLIMGLLKPDGGSVRVLGGDPIRDAETVKAHVGYLAEDQSFPPVLKPRDLFRFFADCFPTWDGDLAHSLIERFRIPTDRALRKLSKGQVRQVMLLCAVAHRPRLLVLDEPGGGLDPVVRRAFLDQVVDLLASEETTVVFSSHHMQEVERLATRVGILHEGQLLFEKDMEELRERCCRLLVTADGLNADEIRRRLPGCVRVARRDDGWLVSLLEDVTSARERVAEALGATVLEGKPLSLEDVFLDLVGEREA